MFCLIPLNFRKALLELSYFTCVLWKLYRNHFSELLESFWKIESRILFEYRLFVVWLDSIWVVLVQDFFNHVDPRLEFSYDILLMQVSLLHRLCWLFIAQLVDFDKLIFLKALACLSPSFWVQDRSQRWSIWKVLKLGVRISVWFLVAIQTFVIKVWCIARIFSWCLISTLILVLQSRELIVLDIEIRAYLFNSWRYGNWHGRWLGVLYIQ